MKGVERGILAEGFRESEVVIQRDHDIKTPLKRCFFGPRNGTNFPESGGGKR